MPGFDINNFRSDVDNRGIQRTNRATLMFSAPTALGGADTRSVCIRCDTVSLPAVWFTMDQEHKRYGVGPTDKVAIQPMFDPFPTSFLADAQGAIHSFFYDWTMLIGNYNTTNGGYEGEYQSNYVTDLYVLTFDETLNQMMQYQFINAYPRAIAEQPMQWGEFDQMVKLNVTFEYREWIQTTASSSLTNTISTIIGSASSAANFLPTGVLDSVLSLI